MHLSCLIRGFTQVGGRREISLLQAKADSALPQHVRRTNRKVHYSRQAKLVRRDDLVEDRETMTNQCKRFRRQSIR